MSRAKRGFWALVVFWYLVAMACVCVSWFAPYLMAGIVKQIVLWVAIYVMGQGGGQ